MVTARVMWQGGWSGCWLSMLPGAGPCDGALVRAHLIPKQLIVREFKRGAFRFDGRWVPKLPPLVTAEGEGLYRWLPTSKIMWDERCWAPACGGPTGIGGHHGRLDGRQLRVPRERLPAPLEEFAEEFGLGWWLDREYGPREEAA